MPTNILLLQELESVISAYARKHLLCHGSEYVYNSICILLDWTLCHCKPDIAPLAPSVETDANPYTTPVLKNLGLPI